jgi:hypothetical protein
MRQDGAMTESSPVPRRRRRRPRRATEPDQPVASPPAPADRSEQAPAKPRKKAAARSGEGQSGRDTDRGWRDLLGNTPSQVGVSGAMRARDVARPTPAELLAAEQDLLIVRRQWKPPEESGR